MHKNDISFLQGKEISFIMAIEKDAVTTVPAPQFDVIKESAAAYGHMGGFFLGSVFGYNHDSKQYNHKSNDKFHATTSPHESGSGIGDPSFGHPSDLTVADYFIFVYHRI